MHRLPSFTDLPDDPWDRIKALISPEQPGGRHREVAMRDLRNARLSVTVRGRQWRLLPPDGPNEASASGSWGRWRNSGVWQRRPDPLRAQGRRSEGRHTHPPAGGLDSPRV
jgi:putative transposase